MHGAKIRKVVYKVCSGEYKSFSLAYVAPALCMGIPEFLDRVEEGLGELAVYSSLYMGLISTAGFSNFNPSTTFSEYTWYYHNGVFASMFLHTSVVLITVFHRLGALGQLRDSDKLLYLWRSRFVPLIAVYCFLWGSLSALLVLMYAVSDTVELGKACFMEVDPSMDSYTWWEQWLGHIHTRVGQGVVYDNGAAVPNPWMQKADALNITASASLKAMNSLRDYIQTKEYFQCELCTSRCCHPSSSFLTAHVPQMKNSWRTISGHFKTANPRLRCKITSGDMTTSIS